MNKFQIMFCATVLITGLMIITGIWLYDGLTHETKTQTIKLEVGCTDKTVYAQKDMLCEDGVQGDVKDAYNGIIWYCDLDNYTNTKKFCLYKETIRITK